MDKEKVEQGLAPSIEPAQGDLPQHVRLLRWAERLGLKPETVADLKASLLPSISPSPSPSPSPAPLDLPRPDAPREQPQPPVGASSLKLEDEFSFRKGAAKAEAAEAGSIESNFDEAEITVIPVSATATPAPAPEPPPACKLAAAPEPAATRAARLDQAMEAELRLRKKVETEQSWAAIRAEAWNLYENFPRPDVAARLSELAFLYGSAAELEEVLSSLLQTSVAFYTQITADIRVHTVVKLWQAKRRACLDGLLFRKDLSLRLLPVERLYCCWSYIEADQSELAYKYFRRHDQEIWSALKQYGGQVKISEGSLNLRLGELALRERDEAAAIQLLESIPRQAPEFQRALDILLDLRVERDQQGLCSYGQKMQRELDWRGRIGLLDSFLLRIQRFEAAAPKDRAALNEWLKNPLAWFPETVEAWEAVAEILLQYQQLEYLLPNLLHVFRVQATQFNRPSYDHALWSAIAEHDFGHPLRNWTWHAIAKVHAFTWNLGEDETLLWEARSLYLEAESHGDQSPPLSWSKLHQGLVHWISKTDRLDESQRQRLLLIARLVGETRDISEADVTNYLTHVNQPSRRVIQALETLTRDRGQAALEAFVLEKKTALTHCTNADLARLWQLAFQLKRYDQCWRLATLARIRKVMHEGLERHWGISGEKKREFAVLDLQNIHLKKITGTFEGNERRLIESLVSIGPLIPELLATLNQHLVPLKRGRGLTESEVEIHSSLERAGWMPQPRKMYSSSSSGLWQKKPPFFGSLLDTKWALLFMALAQRLGIVAWDWQLSLLHHQIEAIVPRMARGSELPMQGRVGRWLRALSPQQRKAWYELAQLSRLIDDESSQLLFARFLAKLTTSMLQDHPLALASLEKMRAPLRLRWDLEHWIASETYGELRRSLGSGTIGQYPDEVFALPLLCKKDEDELTLTFSDAKP